MHIREGYPSRARQRKNMHASLATSSFAPARDCPVQQASDSLSWLGQLHNLLSAAACSRAAAREGRDCRMFMFAPGYSAGSWGCRCCKRKTGSHRYWDIYKAAPPARPPGTAPPSAPQQQEAAPEKIAIPGFGGGEPRWSGNCDW